MASINLHITNVGSCKYGLGSLRKTRTKGIPPIGSGSTSGQLALNLQQLPVWEIYKLYPVIIILKSLLQMVLHRLKAQKKGQ